MNEQALAVLRSVMEGDLMAGVVLIDLLNDMKDPRTERVREIVGKLAWRVHEVWHDVEVDAQLDYDLKGAAALECEGWLRDSIEQLNALFFAELLSHEEIDSARAKLLESLRLVDSQLLVDRDHGSFQHT